jgi:hypothetical protein
MRVAFNSPARKQVVGVFQREDRRPATRRPEVKKTADFIRGQGDQHGFALVRGFKSLLFHQISLGEAVPVKAPGKLILSNE